MVLLPDLKEIYIQISHAICCVYRSCISLFIIRHKKQTALFTIILLYLHVHWNVILWPDFNIDLETRVVTNKYIVLQSDTAKRIYSSHILNLLIIMLCIKKISARNTELIKLINVDSTEEQGRFINQTTITWYLPQGQKTHHHWTC